jgi:dTDP-glucose 4,6-dehydratase
LHEGVDGEIYNVGGYNKRTNLEVVKTIIKTLGKTMDLIEYVTDRLGHDKRYAIDPTKLEKLGWKPTYTFETGIAQTKNGTSKYLVGNTRIILRSSIV